MLRRRLRNLLVVLLLVASGGCVAAGDDDGADSQATTTAARASSSCSGLTYRGVRGTRPTYSSRRTLARFPNDGLLCHGIWLPEPRRHLVPQGLAITGNTAWISGFRYRKGYGKRPCQLTQVDLVTGRRLAYHSTVRGRVGQRSSTYCRHGGGILARGRWLWVVEKGKLWLVDPARKGAVLQARRVWRIAAPVRGSALVATGTRLGLVPYQAGGVPRIYWYDLRSLIRPGVLDLVVRRADRGQLGAVASTRVPRYTQGATLDSRGRLYLTRSNLSCGELVTPFGRRKAFVPGAEGIQFAARDRRLWTVSESGSQPYQAQGKPLTAAVASYEWPRLLRGKPPACDFPAY